MASVVVTGAAFGAALVASGVCLPSVILSQLTWDNYHMLQAFLTATAASALVSAAAQRLGHARLAPRGYADRGWFAPYDGNVVGGLALGAGMALSGACPGTVLAQTALNIRSGYYALGGSFLGGAFWAGVLRPRLAAKKAKKAAAAAPAPAAPLPTDLPTLLGVSPGAALVGLEAAFAAVVGASLARFGSGPDAVVPPVVGGLLIGLAQAVSVGLRKTTLGVSSVYEDVGDWLRYYAGADSSSGKTTTPPTSSLLLALGLVAGARAAVVLVPALGAPAAAADAVAVAPSAALLGGFAMAVGSRLAGGCPSGHGISGMALFSVSSYITMGAAFVGGGVVASFL